MKELPWTKFQDFYLRLGFLKVLVAVLSPDRRSALNDSIVRRLEKPLFDAKRRSERRPPPEVTVERRGSFQGGSDNLVERLLLHGHCASLLYAVTAPTAYKIVDWGRDVGFIGRGNQITERGLLLRHLQDESAAEAFLGGKIDAWNPFPLTLSEKLFLLFHLSEIDGLIFELINDLGSLPRGTIIESHDAARMTSKALLRVLAAAKDDIQPRDVLKYRVACMLASTIADELGMTDMADELIGPLRRKGPRKAKFAIAKGRGTGRSQRRTTKNADHQTIPRFEQLVDLGFLAKPAPENASETESESARKRWRYVPTDICHRWHQAMERRGSDGTSFWWDGFASACLQAFDIRQRTDVVVDDRMVAEYVWRSYLAIQRRAGVNPVESIALFAMILAALDGVRVEMMRVYRLFLDVKQHDRFPDYVSFASGNELDRMFVHVKSGFLEQFTAARP